MNHHQDFLLRRLSRKRSLARTSALLIIPVCFFLVLGLWLAPKAWHAWEVRQAERALSESAAKIAEVPKETFQPSPLPPTPALSPEEVFRRQQVTVSTADLPEEKLLAIPFVCQNPFRDEAGWKFHKESCEEAALLQSVLYLSGKTIVPEEADRIIRDMIAWQERPENFNTHKDLYGEDMRKFIVGYYGLSPDQVVHLRNLDEETIKKVLVLGYPIIMPIQGDLLRNPFYPEPGYHMLTVIGYADGKAITNDVGTKRGEHYPYEWSRLLTANKPVGGDGIVVLSLEHPGSGEGRE